MLLDWELWYLRNSTFLNSLHISSEFNVIYCPECEGQHKSLCAFIGTADRLCCSLVSSTEAFPVLLCLPFVVPTTTAISVLCGITTLLWAGAASAAAGGRFVLGRVVLLMAKQLQIAQQLKIQVRHLHSCCFKQ